jgi:hypothetical protein
MSEKRYTVERIEEKAGKRKRVYSWIVRCPDGSIANDFHHPTEKSAQRHCDNCNAFCLPKGETHEQDHQRR